MTVKYTSEMLYMKLF